MNFSETNGSQNAYGTYLTDTVHVHGPNITFSSLATKSNAAKQTTAMDSARLTCPKMRTYLTNTIHVHGPNLTFSSFATKSKAPKQTTAIYFSEVNVSQNAYLFNGHDIWLRAKSYLLFLYCKGQSSEADGNNGFQRD